MPAMTPPDLLPDLIATEWVSSFIGRAHQGDLFSPDQQVRASAWAHWLVTSMDRFQGYQERSYAGLLLPGSFHDPRGAGPQVRPHLEIPARLLGQPDPWAPDRMALAGNCLLFSKWLVGEVVAVRRCVLPATPAGSPEALGEALQAFAAALVASVASMGQELAGSFEQVEEALVAEPGRLVPEIAGSFAPGEVADFFPPGGNLDLRVDFDAKLKDANGPWTSRRIGAWTLAGSSDGQPFTLGCVTPRVTRGSVLHDTLFRPEREALGALLVRGLVLRRLLKKVVGTTSRTLDPDPRDAGTPSCHLRAIVAKVGSKIPEASTAAAVGFLHACPEPAAGWQALTAWAGDQYLLTVSAEAHGAAHARARRYLLRAEPPEREDVNLLLPLAWDRKGRVVRATFSKGPGPGSPDQGVVPRMPRGDDPAP